MSDNDLVTRLRHVAWLAEEGSVVTNLAAAAADRIEADSIRITELEAQNATLKAAVGEEGRANRMTVMYERSQAENARLREALTALRGWDMLTLNPDGSGCVTHDAPWARKLITAALSGEPTP